MLNNKLNLMALGFAFGCCTLAVHASPAAQTQSQEYYCSEGPDGLAVCGTGIRKNQTSKANDRPVVVLDNQTLGRSQLKSQQVGSGPSAQGVMGGQGTYETNEDDEEGTYLANNGAALGRTMPIRNNFGARPNCAPEALAVGIRHYRYEEANPADLVTIEGGKQLHRDAAAAWSRLKAAAQRDGVNLTILSAYRSKAYQQGIVNRKKARGQSAKQIYYTSSHPGYSEHHTGFAVDFNSLEYSFENSKAYQWLDKNAKAQGWIQSFTRESSRTNGVSYEPWHWKYRGSDAARRALPNWQPSDCN